MNIDFVLFLLSLLVVIYIVYTALKYAFKLLLTTTILISGSTIANAYGGQTATLFFLSLTPVLYVMASDLFGTIRSGKPLFSFVEKQAVEQLHESTGLVEAAPLSGEWISGKTPEITFQQPLIGDVKALPKPWL